MNPTELLELLARRAENTQDLAIQRQLVHSARIGIGGIEHLVRRWRYANGPRRARHKRQDLLVGFQIRFVTDNRTRVLVKRHVKRDHMQEIALAVEYLNPTVAAVRHVDPALGVCRDIMRCVELARLIAAITPGLDPVPIAVDFCDAGIDVAVTDEDLATADRDRRRAQGDQPLDLQPADCA